MDLVERNSDSSIRHPWEIARFRFFTKLLDTRGVLTTKQLLDVGSGDAWFATSLLSNLSEDTHMTCWDAYYSPEDLAIESASPNRLHLTNAQPSGRFGGVLMLDVIEHVEDDTSFVNNIVKNLLQQGGWVLVSVPAYQWLYSEHDRQLKHFRRYSPRQMRTVLLSAGLDIKAEGGVFHTLLIPRIMEVTYERFRQSQPDGIGLGRWSHGPFLTRLVTSVLGAENALSLYVGRQKTLLLPGLSYWAFCTKSEHIDSLD